MGGVTTYYVGNPLRHASAKSLRGGKGFVLAGLSAVTAPSWRGDRP